MPTHEPRRWIPIDEFFDAAGGWATIDVIRPGHERRRPRLGRDDEDQEQQQEAPATEDVPEAPARLRPRR
ncbi:hypothetical protein [Streptomyces sp. XY533]|uniref:hypothetical protein n=1 Tax=Streptomyces sp. XY533 TaxID=1519481 RepID=UPI0006AFF36E|nr:hypothetical protein [Streptomyces sp. XY533]KOU99116.1 hypothetical protein ADK92_13010 [Streptomyces sp. XY533]